MINEQYFSWVFVIATFYSKLYIKYLHIYKKQISKTKIKDNNVGIELGEIAINFFVFLVENLKM